MRGKGIAALLPTAGLAGPLAQLDDSVGREKLIDRKPSALVPDLAPAHARQFHKLSADE
jgi:hypothetical protein